jgi:hypothetical protein
VVQHIERLHLQRKILSFGQLEAARQPEVNLLRPRTIERVQSCKRAGTGSINAECGVGCALQRRSIVDDVPVRLFAGRIEVIIGRAAGRNPGWAGPSAARCSYLT